jgi:hypothetical protein
MTHKQLTVQQLQAINGGKAALNEPEIKQRAKNEKPPQSIMKEADAFTLDDLLPGYLARRFPINLLVI